MVTKFPYINPLNLYVNEVEGKKLVSSQKVRVEFIPGPDLIRNAYVL